MATKIDREDARPATDAGDLPVLFSDETVTIAREEITVREFRYLDGLRAAALARPILAGLRGLADRAEGMAPEAFEALLGEHHEIWLELIARSVGRPAQWVGSLSDRDGTELSLAFWRVNGPFFTRRLLLAAALAKGLDGAYRLRRSSRSSSPSDSAATTATSASA